MSPGFESAASRAALSASSLGLGLLATLHLSAPLWPKIARVKDGEIFDFIIIGSGMGSVVANRLTESTKTKVLVIEAGDLPSVESLLAGLFSQTQNSYQDWSFKSEKEPAAVSQDGGDFNLAAGKVLGGSTSIGHLVYMRAPPEDFEDWVKSTGDENWNYENVLPYFKKSENMMDKSIIDSEYGRFHGTKGELYITKEPKDQANKYFEAFSEVNKPVVLDVTGNDTVGYTHGLLFNNGLRQSTALYLSNARKRKNLYLLTKSLVTEILFDDKNNAVGVKIQLDNKQIISVYARKEVIVSAGVYNTPKLLMLSGIGPVEDLELLNITCRSDLPVGKTLYDHTAVLLAHKMERSVEISEPPKLTELGLPLIIGNVNVDPNNCIPQYQSTNLCLPHDMPYALIVCSNLFGYRNDICDHIQNVGIGHNLFLSLIANLIPESSGSVSLASNDPRDPVVINTGYFTNKQDVIKMAEYIEDFIQVQDSTYFQEVNAELIDMNLEICSDMEPKSKEYWKCYSENMACSLYHQTSTCKMGTVVDSDLLVKGVNNVRIVDASVFPYITKGNPQAAAIMVAEKASDMIKAKHNLN